MGLVNQAIQDLTAFTSDANAFGIAISFTAPGGATAQVNGMSTKHHLDVDTEGRLINGKKASFSVSEALLTAAGYPVRNTEGIVDFKGHTVQIADSTGNTRTYVIREWFPDEMLGLITCLLGDYNV